MHQIQYSNYLVMAVAAGGTPSKAASAISLKQSSFSACPFVSFTLSVVKATITFQSRMSENRG